MVQRLSNLVKVFDNSNLDFRLNRADGDDLLGDACEYLMRQFATEAHASRPFREARDACFRIESDSDDMPEEGGELCGSHE